MNFEKFKDIIRNILAIVLIFYISIALIFFTILNVTKNYINKEKIENIVNKIDLNSIISENAEMNNIKNVLIDTGLNNETVDKFLSSQNVKEFEGHAISNIVYDILSKGDIDYKFDGEQISNLIYNNIDELKNSSQYNQVSKKVEEKLPTLVDNANGMLDKVSEKLQNSSSFTKYKNYINQLFKIFDIMYSNIVNIILILIIASFILMLMFIRKKISTSFKLVGISFIIASILLIIFTNLLSRIFAFTKFDELIKIVANDFTRYYVLYFIISIVLIIINIIAYIIRNRKTNL